MNGAELPCGSQLRVEPSQSNVTKKNASSTIYGPAKTETVASLEDEPTEARNTSESRDAPKETKEDSPNEDLKDFFSSL
jgi:hypothetical protein